MAKKVKKTTKKNKLQSQSIFEEIENNDLRSTLTKKAKETVKNDQKAIPLVNYKETEPAITNKTFDAKTVQEKVKENEVDLKVGEIKNRFNKSLLYTILSALLIFLLFTLPIFAGRSLLSRTVGAINRDAGKVVDTVTNAVLGTGGVDIEKLKESLNTDQACFSLWDDLKGRQINLEDEKYKNINTLKLTNNAGQNTAFLNAIYDLESSQNGQNLYGGGNLKILANGVKLQSLLNIFNGQNIDLGEQNVAASADLLGLATSNITAFTPTQLKINTNAASLNEVLNLRNNNNFDISGSNLVVYGEKNVQNQDQENAINKIKEATQNLLKEKPSEILNDDTGHALAHLSCATIEDIEIGALKNHDLSYETVDEDGKKMGTDVKISTGTAKKVSLIMNDKTISENYGVIQERLNKLIESAKKDETLKSWLKNNYENFKKLSEGGVEMQNLKYGAGTAASPEYLNTKESWDKYVDDYLNGLNVNSAIAETQANMKTFTDLIDLKNEKTDFYVDLKGEVVAIDSASNLGLQAGASSVAGLIFGGETPPEIDELLNSKISARVLTIKNNTDFNYENYLKNVRVENVKSVEELQKDLEVREGVKTFKEKFQPLVDKFNTLTTPPPVVEASELQIEPQVLNVE